MKRILGITALIMLAAAAWGQVSNPSIVKVASDPTGNACTNPSPLQWYAGTYYGCDNTGHRAALGGGGGGGTVSDGAGTTTPGMLAQSTGTAHTITYAQNQCPFITDAPYNAHCDGSTDDTAAIQAAINANTCIQFPISTSGNVQQCNINTPLTGPTSGDLTLTIHGNGSELNYVGATSTAAIGFEGPINVDIDNLDINTQTLSTGNIGVELTSAAASVIQLTNTIISAGPSGLGSGGAAYKAISIGEDVGGGSLINKNLTTDGTIAMGNTSDFAASLADTNTSFVSPGVAEDAYDLVVGAASVTNYADSGGETSGCTFCFLGPTGAPITITNAYFGALTTGHTAISFTSTSPFNNTLLGSAVYTNSGGTFISGTYQGSMIANGTTFFSGGSHAQQRCNGGTQSGVYVVSGSTAATACTTGGGTLVNLGISTP